MKRLNLQIRKDLTVIIIELNYVDLEHEALNQIINNRYYDVLAQIYKYWQIESYILVGLYVHKNQRADMFYFK